MEYGGLVQNCCAFGSLSDDSTSGPVAVPAELGLGGDFIDELLVQGCWVETTDNNNNNNMMCVVADHPSINTQPQQMLIIQQESGDDENSNSSTSTTTSVVGKRWWIGPRPNVSGAGQSVKDRLVVAVGYLKEYYTKNSTTNNVLIQIWVPPPRRSSSGRINHPHPHPHPHHHHHHPHHHHELVTAPNTNTNPNVNIRFFRSEGYPRVHYAEVQQYYDVRGCLALPVFERGTGTCLGVLEIINQNYRPQQLFHNNPLQAVDFRSYQNFIQPCVKVFDELYQAALNEIVEVLTSVCKTHNLPLALTWAPCIQQGKCGCPHYSTEDNNYVHCVSTIDSASFVADLDILGFQEACSEYHLFQGQGIVGTAFTTTKPCFAMDITAFSKAEYPLAHHANMFGLHAAVAIPLRSVYTGSSADFVLEFFLPKDCHDSQGQRHMLNSLSIFVQQACRSLHIVTEDDDDEYFNFTLPLPLPPPPPPPPAPQCKELDHQDDDHIHKLLFASPPPSSSSQVQLVEAEALSLSSSSSSWIAHMMEAQAQAQAQQKGKGVSVSLEYLEDQEPKEEFKVTTTNWDEAQAQTRQVEQISSGSRSVEGELDQCYSFSGTGTRRSSSSSGGHGQAHAHAHAYGRKSGEKRRTKAEKTISLPLLRQYFAGSLKDAAKSIGVCPTTLKRICRQHGITRWPSRKIKKVGHSLKKLQLVIDSVQGADGSIQIGSFYTSFPELCSATTAPSDSSNKMHNNNNNTCYPKTENNNNNNINGLYGHADACSQTFCPTLTTGNLPSINTTNNNINNGNYVLMTETPEALLLNRAHTEADDQLHASIQVQEDTKHFTRSNTQHQTLPPLSETSGWNSREKGAFRVKATFVDEKIRFSLQPNWGFTDLQLEIARRFNLNDVSNIDLKYLDDEGEWVLLACDADLEECKDLHTSSQSRTIRLSLFQASPINLPNTFASSSSPSY